MKTTPAHSLRLACLLGALVAVPGVLSAQIVVDPSTGHGYQAFASTTLTWEQASAAASLLSYNGATGHLATLTSPLETQFVFNNLGGNNLAGYSLGGFQPATETVATANWQWVTGEAWSYTNWNSGEPSDWFGTAPANLENALQIYVNQPQGSTSLTWNDIYRARSTPDNRGYLVEFSVIPEPSTYALLVGIATLGLVSYRRFRRR